MVAFFVGNGGFRSAVVAKIGFVPWLRCASDEKCCSFKPWLRWVQIKVAWQLQTEVAMADGVFRSAAMESSNEKRWRRLDR